MIFIYYPLILISILGYGLFASKKLLFIETKNLGFIGIIGIFFLLIYSYLSSQLIPHDKIFNSITLFLGLVLFYFYFKRKNINFYDFYILLVITLFFLIFILVGKNHDDFHYYHFAYTYHLVENTHSIGLGNLNHGFKTHSSIFYLSSLFYLPGIEYYLFHISSVYIMIFSNFIFLKLVFSKKNFENQKFISLLSLSSLIFINIFFYRLAEHGTDRSAMVFIILLVVNLLLFLNQKKIEKNSDFLKLLLIIFVIVLSLKAFYLIYLVLFFPLIFFIFKKKNSLSMFFNINLFFCIMLFLFVLITNFFNTGCLLFPEKLTCFDKFSWSIPIETVELLKIHYENWAKAGSGAGYVNEMDKKIYIENFNWLPNWIEMYFFNKVFDFLLSLLFIIIILFLIFKEKEKIKKKKRLYKPIIFVLFGIFVVWFCVHPSLRYGGYHLFFLLAFIPLCLLLENYKNSFQNFLFKAKILLFLTIIIFLGRNVDRLVHEYKKYSYNPIKNSKFMINEETLKIDNTFKKLKQNQSFCDKKSTKCDSKLYKLKEIYQNRYIIYRN